MPEPSGNLYDQVWGESNPEPPGPAPQAGDEASGEVGAAACSPLTGEQLETVLLRIESRLVTLENQVRITNRSLALISDRLWGSDLPPDSIWSDIHRAAPPQQ